MYSCSAAIPPAAQRGMVLLLSLVFLLLLALVAGTAMQISALEFRMAGNHQFREEARQVAQALAAAIVEKPDNFPLGGRVGDTVCPAACTVSRPDMIERIDAAALPPAPVELKYWVERLGPLFRDDLPARLAESESASAVAYDAVTFEVRAQVDGATAGLGRGEVARGVAILVPASRASTGR